MPVRGPTGSLPGCVLVTAVSMCGEPETLSPSPRAASSLSACSVSLLHYAHWQKPWRVLALHSALSPRAALSLTPFIQSLGVPWWVVFSVLSFPIPMPCLVGKDQSCSLEEPRITRFPQHWLFALVRLCPTWASIPKRPNSRTNHDIIDMV